MSYFSKVHERVIRKFIVHNVDFVLIGGHASIIHGVRRTTSDLDILIRPSRENASKVYAALNSLQLDLTGTQEEDFLTEQVFSFGMEPHSVDILNFSKGVLLEEIFDHAVERKIDNLRIPVIDIRDLIKNKQNIANRSTEKGLVDQQDVIALNRILKSLE